MSATSGSRWIAHPAGAGAPAGSEQIRDSLAILVGCGMWGLAWWPMQALGARGLDGPALALVGYSALAACLLPAVRGQLRELRRYGRSLVAIAIAGGLWNLAYATAMVEGHASRVVLLYFVSCGWAIPGGRLFLREPIGGSRVLAMLLVSSGAFLVLGGPNLEPGRVCALDLLAILAGLAHACTNLLFRANEPLPLAAKNLAMFLGAAGAAGLVLLSRPSPATAPPASALLAGALFAVVWLLPAETLTQRGVSRLPAARASILSISELLFTVLSAALIGGESLGPTELVGGAAIAAAALLEVHRPARLRPVGRILAKEARS